MPKKKEDDIQDISIQEPELNGPEVQEPETAEEEKKEVVVKKANTNPVDMVNNINKVLNVVDGKFTELHTAKERLLYLRGVIGKGGAIPDADIVKETAEFTKKYVD